LAKKLKQGVVSSITISTFSTWWKKEGAAAVYNEVSLQELLLYTLYMFSIYTNTH
jgi:hypothetical protein